MTRSETLDEASLIRAAQRGGLGAFKSLVELHHGGVRSFLAVRMNNALEAEDLAQETLIMAFKKLPELDAERPLGPWLRGVAQNLLANHRRKFRPIPIGASEELQAMLDARAEQDAPLGNESDRLGALRDCLDEMDGAARELLHARYTDGDSLANLSLRLGRRHSAISMQLHRLRHLLATCIEGKLQLATPHP